MSDSRSIHRRRWLSGSAAAAASATGLSTALGFGMSRLAASETESDHASAFKRCLMLWMGGGPSQLDTFDPKPGTQTGGPLTSVSTSVPGLAFCETLSQLADHADDLCLIRSIGSKQGEHERASYLLHTGYEQVISFPRPGLGAFVSHRERPTDVPGYAILGDQVYGAAYLGSDHAPFVVDDFQSASQMLDRVGRRVDRLDLIEQLNGRSAVDSPPIATADRDRQIESLRRLLGSPFANSMKIDQESEATRSRYGDSDFGRNVLVGRRMLEAGVRYVEVQMPGWDTHVGNFPAVGKLCDQLQPAWLALMNDLKANGMWQDTLIVWMGEFGRTPTINGQNGRDHYPGCIPVVLAGGTLGGRVIGSTGRDGQQNAGETHRVADLMHTLMTLLGVDAESEFTTAFGSPTSATDGGEMIEGIAS